MITRKSHKRRSHYYLPFMLIGLVLGVYAVLVLWGELSFSPSSILGEVTTSLPPFESNGPMAALLTPTPPPLSEAALTERWTNQNFQLLKRLWEKDPTSNTAVATPNLVAGLSSLLMGSSGATHTELSTFLTAEPNRNTTDVAQVLQTNRTSWEHPGESISFIQEVIGIHSPSLTLDATYGANAQSLFGTTWQATGTTESPASLSLTTKFQAPWQYAFNQSVTHPRLFQAQNGEKKFVSMMKLTRSDFIYSETDAYQLVRLPYGDGTRWSLAVLLPKISLLELVDRLGGEGAWKAADASATQQEGTVIIPKFTFAPTQELEDPLRALGLQTALGPTGEYAALSPDMLTVSDITQRVELKFSEEGVNASNQNAVPVPSPASSASLLTSPTATAETSPAASAGAPELHPRFIFEANKPFLFVVEDQQTGQLVLSGIVSDPTK